MTFTPRRNSSNLANPSLFPAFKRQTDRLIERKNSGIIQARVSDKEFEVFPGVYQTSVDTELIAKAVRMRETESFLEVGCGCGAVSLLIAANCLGGVGVDINPTAVENALRNREKLGVRNVEFKISDVFEEISGQYDVLICNPPYNNHHVVDIADRMFWDPDDDMKRRFFLGADRFLKPDGRIYFGWADFADLDNMLPLRLSEAAGFRYVRHYVAPSRSSVQGFFVVELRRKKAADGEAGISRLHASNA